VAFLLTFTWLRIMIFLIMDRRLPDMYVYAGGTHVHHLNFGIFLLAALGAYQLFGRQRERSLEVVALLYGVGLALTFDEFGMWLHLGGGYWQRASFDAVTVIAGFLVLLAFLPPARDLRGRHAFAAAVLLALGAAFFILLLRTVNKYGDRIGPRPARPSLSGKDRRSSAWTGRTRSLPTRSASAFVRARARLRTSIIRRGSVLRLSRRPLA